jgi:hypothetical protein
MTDIMQESDFLHLSQNEEPAPKRMRYDSDGAPASDQSLAQHDHTGFFSCPVCHPQRYALDSAKHYGTPVAGR